MVERLLLERAGTLIFEAPAQVGTISAATVRLSTPATAMPDTDSAATVEGFSDVLSAAASRGDTSLSFAAPVSLAAGRRYVLDVNGLPLAVVPVQDGSTVYLKEPLPMDVPNGTTMRSSVCSVALGADDTALSGQGLAIWTLTIDGNYHTYTQTFRVSLGLVSYTLDATKLSWLAPEIQSLQPDSDLALDEVIEAAWQVEIEPRLWAKGFDPARVRAWSGLEPAHAHACILVAMRAAGADYVEMDNRRHELDLAFERVLSSAEFFYDSEDGETTPPDEPYVAWSSISLSR